jgi:hypothetical protein
MKLVFALLTVAMLASGCSSTPARYAVSSDNKAALAPYAGKKVKVASIVATVPYDASCQLAGPIHAADGVTIPQFIEGAFNEELKAANVYGDGGALLTGKLTRFDFSDGSDPDGGYWDLGLTLSSSNNGNSLHIENRYRFPSAVNGVTPCNQTAQALGLAVQDLITQIIAYPDFSSLLN